jgi:hypothetical protein
MSLFKKASMQTAYLKMGVYGEAGSGKTYTASRVARGLAEYLEKQGFAKPAVMFLDTETGANWVQPFFADAGIEFYVASTRSFEDLKQAVVEAEQAQAILIADSMTHFWQEVQDAYLEEKKKRTSKKYAKLEFQDWATLKPEWGKFTSLYLNSRCHIILCGRAGNIYEYQDAAEGGRKELITSGTRMAAEKGMGYEPSILVEMTSKQVSNAKKSKTIVRTATVLKDRSTLLDGKQCDNPDFRFFLPHVKKLNLGGAHAGFDASRNSSKLFPKEERDDKRFDRDILLEELQVLLDTHGLGGTSSEAKAGRPVLLRRFFGTASKTEIEKKIPMNDLLVAFNGLHIELEGVPSRYFPAEEEVDDEIPHLNGAAPQMIERSLSQAGDEAA